MTWPDPTSTWKWGYRQTKEVHFGNAVFEPTREFFLIERENLRNMGRDKAPFLCAYVHKDLNEKLADLSGG